MSNDTKIDLLFIGAPKCGTTWLTRRLSENPQIAMPTDEIHYYSRFYDRGAEWYGRQFAGLEGMVRAENSNSYLTEANIALPRIIEQQPEAKILCILRNPVDRAYSSYGMQVDRGRATDEIERYLDPRTSPRPHILSNGLYAKLLEPWFAAFPAERIMVHRFERIRNEPTELLRDVCDFLGVANHSPDEALDRPDNARKQEGIPGGVKRALWWARPAFNSSIGKALVRSAVGQAAVSAISRRKSYPPLSDIVRERLNAYYKDDVARLEYLTGQSFAGWLRS